MKPDLIAPSFFGLVHRTVRPLEYIFRLGFVIDKQHDANTRGAMMFDRCFCFFLVQEFQHIWLIQGGSNFFGDDAGLRGRFGLVLFQLTEHHHKLVTPKTRNSIHFTHALSNAPSCLHQQQVPHIMSVRIIERFKVIQIEKHHRTITATALAGRHDFVQPVKQQSAIGELRQAVVEGQIVDFLFRRLALGDVTPNAKHANQPP